ncbi:hypothetical protein TCA2_4463 [Paenibacillus sp. TCA20]|uniref:Uncharacterized protein n=1 Tax=Paenibacillus urinalis TaxID=521520 RepID=A0ABY7XK12_9BACL|nr:MULTISPECIES: hypothetical protein [Paenibacillus]WDI05200.1 hypothetical protein PUW25_25670 [Paenibacillus urinalis]GAK41971.1 hypothetical protein TCA2_4463 [Paenibacillus sp. TCA20]
MKGMPVVVKKVPYLYGPEKEKVYFAHQLIHLEAMGRSDYWGEEFIPDGNYSFKVEPDTFYNLYNYTGRLDHKRVHYYDKRQKRRVWRSLYDLHLQFNQHGQVHVLCKTSGVTKQQARKIIVREVIKFEKTSYVRKHIWPKVIHKHRLTHIFKNFGDRGHLWVSSTWGEPIDTICEKRFGRITKSPLGIGKFYTYKPKFKVNFSSWINSSSSDLKGEYQNPDISYINYSGGSYSRSSCHDNDLLLEIEAQLDLNNLMKKYHDQQRYESIFNT